MNNTAKAQFKKDFEKVFKGCKLYCLQLNGFSHTIFYKDSKGYKHIGVYSGYASPCECDDEETLYDDNVYRSYSTQQLKELLGNFGHWCYQHNAKEIIFENHCKW